MDSTETIAQRLAENNQSHLLGFSDELDDDRRKALLEQLATLDFEQINELVDKYVRNSSQVVPTGEITPPEVFPARPTEPADIALSGQAIRRGQELLAAGKVAAFVVAGGQGTRLGYEGPKGCLEATPVTRKPLFQLFAEQILAAAKRAEITIPFYIMTSPANDVATRAFFRRNDYFGLDENDVFFLVQGTMPAIDFDGKLLLAKKHALATNPDGHGGSLVALQASGALADMADRGIELISYFQVDNPLVKCIDPLFIGLHALRNAEMSAKVLPKRDPMERLGNLCVADGKPIVIEYSDMPDELARATTDDGRLKFSAGSIAIHILSRTFVERITAGGDCKLPLHRAEKKVPYIDAEGNRVEPSEPNAVKLERFIFDALPLASVSVVLETVRSEEFSPIKNAEGSDSPASSLHDQVRRAAKWLEAADVAVPHDADGEIAAAIEISPLYADSPEALATKITDEIKISAGQSFYLGSRGQTGGLR